MFALFSSRRLAPSRLLSLALSGALGLASVGSLAGCRPQLRVSTFDSELAADHAARLEAWLAKHPADAQARLELAHVYWLHLGQVEAAIVELDTLTALDSPPPLARWSRATIAQHQLDVARAWTEFEALLREAPQYARARDRKLALALTPFAARSLDALEGLSQGDSEAFIALFDSLRPALDAGTYPGETVGQLLSTRGGIARRLEQDYRELYTRQGCIQDWTIGELEGYRGPLELSRLEVDRSFRVDPEATSTALSCAVRVPNVEPGAALRRLRTTVELPAGQTQMRLSIGTQHDARVYVDDQIVWARDRSDRYAVDGPTFVLPVGPGVHRIEVRTVIPSERAWVLVRATDLAGRPLAAKADSEAKGDFRLDWGSEPGAARQAPGASADAYLEVQPWQDGDLGLRGPVYAPLREFLALADALSDGDTDRAEHVAEQLRVQGPNFANAHVLLAEFEFQDPSRGSTTSTSRQQGELEAAIAADPEILQAQLGLLSLRLDRGEVAEVIEALEQLPEQGRSSGETLLFSLLRFDAYRRRGSDLLAERALERAAQTHPQNCEVLMARRELIRERIQVEAEDEVVAALRSCSGSLGIRARLALTRERFDEARELWLEQLARIPDDIDAMEALASIAVAQGDYTEAQRWQTQMLELAPYRALSLIQLADLAARRGSSSDVKGDPEAARAFVQRAIDMYPHNSRLREVGERIGIEDELLRWRIDGSEALTEYRADLERGEAAEGVSEVLLLDREVSMLYADGGHRHIVHQMFHILSDQAIDAHGEFSQPGVRLLTMHSMKPDGSIVEPESIAGKEGLSLRGLAIGDVVEIEFVFDTGPEPALPGHVDLGRFRFQSPELPFHRSELIALIPEALASKVHIEGRNDAPAPARKALQLHEGAYSELTFIARQVPRLGLEAGARSMMDELPMVQLHVPLVVEDWLDQLSAALRPAQRSNPELRALAEQLTGQYTNTYDKIDVLWRWVVDEIEDTGDLSTPATVTLSGHQGSRLMLLRALCQAAGVDSQLWLLRDRFGPSIYPDGDPLVESYDTAMLAVFPDGETPLLVGTSSEVIPLGYLAPSYAGGRALRLRLEDGEPEPGYVDVPQNPAAHADLRRWDIEVELDATGNGIMRGHVALSGLEAVSWRNVFDQVDSGRLPEVFTQAELGRMLPGAGIDLGQLEFENQWELELPLIIHFTARVRDAGVVQGNELVLLAAAVPIDPATGYTRLPSRWSGMVIPYAPTLEAKVRYLVGGASFSEVPPDVALEDARGSYTRRVSAGGVGQSELVIESRSTLVPGIVEAEDYGALAQFAGQVQVAEQQLLRARGI